MPRTRGSISFRAMTKTLATKEWVALNADVVGYSKLLADDFQRTTTRMEEIRALVTEEVSQGAGTLIDFTGDNFMALFEGATSAVRTAISIASTLALRNEQAPPNQRLRFRMGIDSGSVTQSDGHYFGDSLNVAARIQAIAPEGGLSVSGDVYRSLDEPALRFTPLGSRSLKNIPEPVEVFEFKDLPYDRVGGHDGLSLATPSLAVLPIHTESVAPEVAASAGVIRADMIHRLSRIPQLEVFDTGPDENRLGVPARYVIESGIHTLGDQVRVYAQLIDVTTWNIVKSHRFNAPVSELFSLSEKLAEEIARSLEIDLVVGAPAGLYSELDDPEAIERIYRGWWHLTSLTPEGWKKALDLFESVQESHADQPYGHSLSAFTEWYGVITGVSKEPSESLQKAYDKASIAVEMGDPTGMSAMVMAAVLMSRRKYEEALDVMEGVEIARPTCDATYGIESSLRRYVGDWERAIDLSDTAMRLTGVNKPWYPTIKACSLFMAGQWEQAANVAEMVVEHQPHNLEALLVLAATQAELGLERRAKATAGMIRERFPATDVERWLDQNPYRDSGVVDNWKTALAKAGVLDRL